MLQRTESATAPLLGGWSLPLAAQILSALLGRHCPVDEVRDRAIGHGLLHVPAPDEPFELTTASLARLFLTPYHLPAHLTNGTLAELQGHLAEVPVVLVLLDRCHLEMGDATSVGGQAVYRLRRFVVDGAGNHQAELAEANEATGVDRIPLATFLGAWEAAGSWMILAVEQWADLPESGMLFFGGMRDRDGSYHWNTAECDTDGEGVVLRF